MYIKIDDFAMFPLCVICAVRCCFIPNFKILSSLEVPVLKDP